jgi:hypothetical protein
VGAKRAPDKYFLDAKNSASCAIFRGEMFFARKNKNARGGRTRGGVRGVSPRAAEKRVQVGARCGARPGVEPVLRTGWITAARWLAIKHASRIFEFRGRSSNPSGGRVPPATRVTPLPAAAGPVGPVDACWHPGVRPGFLLPLCSAEHPGFVRAGRPANETRAKPRCGLLATRGMSRILASQNPGIKKAPGLHRAPWELSRTWA